MIIVLMISKAFYPMFIIVLVNIKRSERGEENLPEIICNTAMRFVDSENDGRHSTTVHVAVTHLTSMEEGVVEDGSTLFRASTK